MLEFEQKGNFKTTLKFLQRASEKRYLKVFTKYGAEGVRALSKATPVDTGKTAASWSYEIVQSNRGATITWNNSNSVNGVPIAIVIQYGHATRGGTFVEGRDYINPALRPIFDKMASEIWKEVRG